MPKTVSQTNTHNQEELRETLLAMKALLSRARKIAEPILARWDEEELRETLWAATLSRTPIPAPAVPSSVSTLRRSSRETR